MSELLTVTGMVIKCSDYAEYDKRLLILTMDRGKITVFAHGARRSGNRLMGPTEPFVYGDFTVSEGKSAYTLYEAKIINFFEGIRNDLSVFYTGSYFLEIADYYTRENNDDAALLKLLYVCVNALVKKDADIPLIRAVFEIRSIVANGEFPGIQSNILGHQMKNGTAVAIDHAVNSPMKSLLAFKLSDEVREEFIGAAERYMNLCVPKIFNSLELIKTLEI
ncbi:MAG: DNA repair protein RecO [Lachnospiraceae bacterium]|nr:DNA repair protein RecO [Lachnospiraceae bacterium]